jgi:superfamily II DNA or RNA helicase
MAAIRFSWDAFDDAAVAVMSRSAHGPTSPAEARAWLRKVHPRPSEAFIDDHREAIERGWLANYTGLGTLVDRLVACGLGGGRKPSSPGRYLDYVQRCRNSKNFRRLLLEAILRYGDQDRPSSPDEESPTDLGIPRFARVDPAAQTDPDRRKPHPYQEEAWQRLDASVNVVPADKLWRGLLVMPTGAGKTFTSVRWAVDRVLSRGQRVLWIAHRHELLEQAAREFHTSLAFARRTGSPYRVRIVSGVHCAATMVDPADHVVVASIASLARNPEVVDLLVKDPERFVVIDEAHHAPAKSYRDLIRKLETCRRGRILGITATPTRTVDAERGVLASLFGRTIVHEVLLRDLVERRFLARPKPVRVETGAEVERDVTSDDEKYLARYNELSEAWQDRIAKLNARNHLIVEHWFANRAKYGKTLVYAINVAHADLLTQHFAERLKGTGVEVDYVASYRPDGSEIDNRAVLARFRERNGALKVLVNVQILTEGVDLPDVQTVLLARPTNSEILMRQMVGRALRGPLAGGTAEAFIVSFEDHWDRFRDWESPFSLVPDLMELAEPAPVDEPAVVVVPKTVVDELPWDLIREVAAAIRAKGITHLADAFDAVPDGWYVLEREVEDDAVRQVIAVYAHQRPCWEAFLTALWTRSPDQLDDARVASLERKYFGDCDIPLPARHDLLRAVTHRWEGGDRPTFAPFEARDACDPERVAQTIFTQDLSRSAQRRLVEERYVEALAKAIYPTFREYEGAVSDALHELERPEESTKSHRAVPVFEPGPTEMLRPGPHHDLARELAAMLEVGARILGIPSLPSEGIELQWTTHIVKGWYAMAHYANDTPPATGLIRVNRLLDSPDIGAETMRFLLWHEYLHLYLKQAHTKTFRELERKYPSRLESDRELFTLNERFGVQYW